MRAGRQQGYAYGMVAIFAALGLAVWALDQSPVRHLALAGELSAAQRADLGQALAPFKAAPAPAAALQAALEARPWVSQVKLSRAWPFGLRAEVVPEQAIAYWNGQAFISERMQVLRTGLLPAAPLPRLAGPPDSAPEVIKGYQQFARTLAGSRHRIASLSLSSRGAWSLATTDGLQVQLGREATHRRLERFIDLSQRLDRRGLAYDLVDARYPTGLAVRLIDKPQRIITPPAEGAFHRRFAPAAGASNGVAIDGGGATSAAGASSYAGGVASALGPPTRQMQAFGALPLRGGVMQGGLHE